MSDAAALPRRARAAGSLWSDGIHFVRSAAPRDRHKMRFVVAAHRATASPFKRHAPTLDAGIELATAATASWLKAHPADRPNQKSETPATTAASPSGEVRLTPFATTLFICVSANPVAQVWRCVAWPGERGPVGRRSETGKAAQQTPVPHHPDQYAVMRGQEPIRNPDGTVRVFMTWGEAEEYADNLYEDEPGENTISWKRPNLRVAAGSRVEVLFDPDNNGEKKPFILWLPEFGRPVYEDRTRATLGKDGINPSAIQTDAQLRLDLEEARRRARSEDRQPSFEEKPMQFKSIWTAIEEADRREQMLLGRAVR